MPITRHRNIRRPARKRRIDQPRDNKKLKILDILNQRASGYTRNQISKKLPRTQDDDIMKDVLNEMIGNEWVKSSVVPFGEKQMTHYKITKQGKKALKEHKEIIESENELKKLDVFQADIDG